MNVQLIVIDPQKDFCATDGALSVPGAVRDIDRLSLMVKRLGGKLDKIHVTLDSHRKVDISHPIWWKDSKGQHPAPFTIITASDVADGVWTTTKPGMLKRSLQYLKDLEARQRYPHCIWPEHCKIGSEGHSIMTDFFDALSEWEDDFRLVNYVTKGSNPWTEHFSGVMAEVPDPQDPTTQLNTQLIQTLEEADITLWSGQARSHCLANTVRDVAANFSGTDFIGRMHLLTDACSDVPTFEKLGEDFVRDMTARGMKLTTTTDFLA